MTTKTQVSAAAIVEDDLEHVNERNATETLFPVDVCIHELIEAQVERTPNTPAVVFEGQLLTYRELNERANQLAHYLQKLGVRPDSLVGICVERSLEMVVGLLGILKAGGAYVPFDPAYPRERLEFMLEDAGVSVLLTQEKLIGLLDEEQARVVCLDTGWGAIAQESSANVDSGVCANNLAYVIYTSGSTGRPKGVMNEHAGVCNRLFAAQAVNALTSADRVLQKTPFSFDVSVWEFFWTLMTGARMIVARPEGHKDADYLVRLITKENVTVLHFVPSMLQVFLNDQNVEQCRSIRYVVCSGEALPFALQQRFFERLDARLDNFYGPTEAAVDVTYWRCQRDSDLKIVPIGRPLANTDIYILDPDLNPVPAGVPGELHIGGIQVARGYLNRPELTEEKFIADSFSADPEARLYKTGDLCRYLPDGNIEYLGRLDHQVKIRGFRIELGEIEAVLAQHHAVREVVVVAREDVPGDKRLVAYLVADPLSAPSISEMRSLLQAELPDYMVPSAFVFLDNLPLTPNGKVDRKALPVPEQTRPKLETTFVAPRTHLEEFLADIWREVLHVEEIGIHDNFFELGGNSILGAVFINKVQQKLDVFVYIIAVFDAPTIAQFAAFLNARYKDAVTKHFSGATADSAEAKANSDHAAAINSAQVAQIRALIPSLPPCEESNNAKNPPAVFILSTPRSGTTLLRVMLAGHPRLFAPPELELLEFDTLADRKAALSDRFSMWLEGTIRAIMDIKGCDADQAKRIMAACEERKLTTKQFYREMQQWIGDRILVDKSTNYALDIEALRRAESYFDEAFYIHLSRHPFGMIRSFQDVSLEQIFFWHEHPFSARELAELVWLVCHQNIQEFLGRVPENRQYRLKYEDLVSRPQEILTEMCQFMGLDFHPNMARPYKDKQKRMTDGIHAASRMLGDIKFHQHADVDPALADRWKETQSEDDLGDITWQIAEELGYEHPPATSVQALAPMRRNPRTADAQLPLSFSQERLWILDQLESDGGAYNLPLVIRLSGPLDGDALNKSLNEIVRRHDSLRATFRSVAGTPVSVISAEFALTPSVIGLEQLPVHKRKGEARRLAIEQARRPFDLSRDPLIRVALLRLDEEEHWLLVTMHHIVCDGWSLSIFQRELAQLYTAFCSQQPSPLTELPIQYSDFAEWQREQLAALLDTQLAYWQQQLHDAPAVLDLPFDRPRPALQTFRGARRTLTIPRTLADSLQALGQQEQATLFMTLLAAFQTLLFRYSGQVDISVGSPIAGRNRAEVEQLIGFFVNTLVLRTDLAGNPSFRELLARVRTVALGAYAHQELPFEKLVEELDPERSLSHSPLFQVMFALQNAPASDAETPGLTMCREFIDCGTAMFDLTLFVFPTAQGLTFRLEYNTDLFDAATITRMLGHFQTLLEGIATNPDQRLTDLPLLSQAERHQLLTEWNATEADYPQTECLHQLFEKQVEQTPDAVAVVFEDKQLTYGQLNARANQLAHHLQALGVQRDTLVGISVERSPEMMVGLLGILKAGAAYVPLDPTYPEERLAFMLADSQTRILVTQQSLVEKLPRYEGTVLCLDAHWPQISRANEENPVSEANPLDRAYVIYTSGSSGRPKGVQIPHRAAVNFLHSMRQRPGLTDQDVLLAVTTLSFDIALLELFLPISVGARVVVVSTEVAADGSRLQEQLATSGATVMQATPATWRLLFETAWAGNKQLKVLCGGEALPPELARKLHQSCASLWNMYGPTETTVWSTVHQIRSGDEPILIGRPIANTQVYVLDAQRKPVPIGVQGELFIGGDGLARGYLNRPDLTAASFIVHPFSNEPETRLYATGDLARYLPNGDIECLGRRDHQVKLRGFRIELGEIEAILAQHPGLREVVVVSREDKPGEQRLVAYVVSAEEPSPASGDVRKFVQAKLPDYMVPAAYVTLEAIPLTPNGKVNRRALPAPRQVNQEGEDTFLAPRDNLERQLKEIWENVLDIQSVGVRDDFFALGGHSLLAVKLVDHVDRAFGKSFPVITLLQAPTIELLADVLRQEGCSTVSHSHLHNAYRSVGLISKMRSACAAVYRQVRSHGTKSNRP